MRAAFRVASVAALAIAATTASHAESPGAANPAVKRGAYLVRFGGCNDCHTPKVMTPRGPAPDPGRELSGHPASVTLPPPPDLAPDKWMAATNGDLTAWVGPWGVSYAANLTPHRRTGLGDWTVEQFVKTMRTGKHLGTGREILPPMPWEDLAALNDQDLRAIFAYLRSIRPIENQVPAPLPPK